MCTVSWYQNFARLVFPPRKEPKKEKPLWFELDNEERNAVDLLKNKLVTPPVLVLPRLNGR